MCSALLKRVRNDVQLWFIMSGLSVLLAAKYEGKKNNNKYAQKL
jgi:hypothetical protein